MKANRKFIRGDDEAVSPVIAVILMVAITVVLAATVYVWVSGFGSQSSQPAKSVSLSSAGTIDSTTISGKFLKSYTVAAATAGMRYSDISLTLNGVPLAFDVSGCTADADAEWTACGGTTTRQAADVITAGDTIKLRTATTPAGQVLRVLDLASNSVIGSVTVG